MVTRAIFLCLALAVLAGCVHAAQREVAAARTAHEACVAEAGAEQCGAQRERLLAAERAYQESARRAWGCDPVQADCPTPR